MLLDGKKNITIIVPLSAWSKRQFKITYNKHDHGVDTLHPNPPFRYYITAAIVRGGLEYIQNIIPDGDLEKSHAHNINSRWLEDQCTARGVGVCVTSNCTFFPTAPVPDRCDRVLYLLFIFMRI